MKHHPSPEIVNPLRGRCRGTLLPAALGVIVLLGAVSSPLMARVKIEHKPIKKSTSGQRIAVEAEIGDRSAGIREARAYFKSGFDHRFWFAPMRQDHRGQFVGILPAPSVGAGTVQYQIYAVNGANDFVKTQIYTIDIEDDRQALARAQARQPTDVEIDLDRIEQLRDLARRAGEPNPEQRVEVRNDVPDSPNPQALHGFEDYIVMAHAQPAAAGAGLAGASAVKASAGGIGMGKILGGAILLGGVAVAANEYLDDDEDSGAPSSLSGVWAFSLKCQGNPQVVLNTDVSISQSGGSFSTTGSGTDINGTPLTIRLSGTYSGSSGHLSGQFELLPPSSHRLDTYSTTLTSTDSGWVATSCRQHCGCPAEIRIVRR